ncbi:hypothetical protein [Dyella tabacisoli]|uniref:hypothetical protein n=1 Tax=Dyella tabacisoli TaxID=2282381 RepID=UPI001CDC1CFD|nr:hypothetical protein [Dyella tabacisoli]
MSIMFAMAANTLERWLKSTSASGVSEWHSAREMATNARCKCIGFGCGHLEAPFRWSRRPVLYKVDALFLRLLSYEFPHPVADVRRRKTNSAVCG